MLKMQRNVAKPLVVCAAIVIAVILFLNRSKPVSKTVSLSEQSKVALSVPSPVLFTDEGASVKAVSGTGSSGVSQKISTLKQIFESKNDNDPRLDSDFRNLSDESKESLRQLYSEIKKENRNERGTIVFLLGREVKSVDELGFFRKVLDENPCLSLQNCGKLAPPVKDEHTHLDSATQVTLLYPQIMALRMQERVYSTSTDSGVKEGALAIIETATHSSISELSQEARSILSRITSR